MPKYLLQASYTVEGLKGLKKAKAFSRKAAVAKLVKAIGGKLETLYFALGDYDILAIVDMPDATSAAAMSLAVSATGVCRSIATTALLDLGEMDAALAKSDVGFRGPGQ